MKIFTFIIIHYFFSIALANEIGTPDDVIKKTESQFRSVDNYQVDMMISIAIPAFRMPKKKYKVFFKQPDKIKIKSRGFGLLPKTGMFTSPMENFNNLTNIRFADSGNKEYNDKIILVGDLIVDSLALEMPNEYARLAFKPTVDVSIDKRNWVITQVVTKIDTLKIMEINNTFDYIDNSFYLPVRSTVEYFVKDARLTKWINKDIGTMIGNQNEIDVKNDMVRGLISVEYSRYKINKGIKDSVFDD